MNQFRSGAPGRLSPDEYRQIVEHVEQCASCRTANAEFLSFLEQLPAEEHEKASAELARHMEQGGLQERFMQRARAVGIQFSNAPAKRPPAKLHVPSLNYWAVAAAALGIFMGAMGQRVIHRAPQSSAVTATQAAESRSLAALDQSNHHLEATVAELQAAIRIAKKRTSALQDENSAMLVQVAALGRDLMGRRAENRSLEQAVVHWREVSTEQVTQNDHAAQLLGRTEADLEEARAHGKALEAQLAELQEEARGLSEQLTVKSAAITHDRELLVAGRDITDLMGARNLHIIDVRDADGKGKNRKSFGRIFYTEGKSLIFYAYDLDDGKGGKANCAFEVWGERLGEPASVRSLGILYTDDKVQKRWALSIHDPQQLAEIDSVFVTLESHQGASRPIGGKILFAFLGGQANHP